MASTRSTTLLAAPALALATLLLAGACGNSTNENAVTTDGPASEAATSADRISLADDFTTGSTRPVWEFPLSVDGWTLTVIDQDGVNQLSRAGGLFTSFQLDQGTQGGDDEGNSRAYLDTYYSAQQNSPGVESVSAADPTTTTLPSDRGDLEFLSQEVQYTTTNGTTYHSRMLVRSLDTNVLVLQYAAPEDEWSEAEWEKLTADVRVQLG
ncbi:hypothetical protein [Nocardioides sp. AE5]|uniref:hypothetical protein n=1 Tax=Nocardioides sp. AE5 TaxID=2962573 RepID=UPI0028820473|nr:hypothetical protein [Nocardioides sp. AE5]MDT0201102.1 hypothetical protein [Nocardioides sp. AE5]